MRRKQPTSRRRGRMAWPPAGAGGPASGVIASANVVAGQVVDARELVFEIVDPSRLRVEASA